MQKQKSENLKSFGSFEEFFAQAEQNPQHWIELAKLEFTNEVIRRMKDLGMTRGELAARLEVRPGMVTRLLSGSNNFELATMVKLARALNCEFRSHLQPSGTKTCWIDVLSDDPQRSTVARSNRQLKAVRK